MHSSILVHLVALTAFACSGLALVLSTPAQLVTCEPALISWAGGQAPYFLDVIPGGQIDAAPIETFPTQEGHSYVWPAVNIAAGTTITLELRDSTGRVAFSSPVTVQAGPDSSCVGGGTSEGLVIITPASAVQCEPVLLSWSGGEAPYYLEVIPGGQVSAAPIETFPAQTGTSYTWTVNVAAGTSLTLELRDSTGEIVYSAPFTVQQSDTSSCLSSK